MQENLKALFEGVEGLSEDFHIKLETLVEAKVADRVEAEISQIKEQAESSVLEEKLALKEAAEQYAAYVKDELAEQVTKVVNEVAGKWLEANKVALVSESKVEMAESVLTMIQSLFESSGLKVTPDVQAILEEKDKALEEAQAQLIELESKLQEAADAEFAAKKAALFEAELADLADTQKEKAIRIVESFSDESLDAIKVRLTAVRSLVEAKELEQEVVEKSDLNESVEQTSAESDPVMDMIKTHFSKKSAR